MIMISIGDITKSYGDTQVLRGVSISIDRGEVLAIVGPSGAGKTTLLQIAGTLARPDGGSVIYTCTDGRKMDVLAMNDVELSRFRNRHIGFVFQMHRLLPEFSLVENVELPALIAGSSRSQARSRAMELIDYLGLGARASHRPSQLSGGECQRAAVARALINTPDVVLADEPSGSLDSHNRTELHRLFFDLRRDMGVTFVIVTHDEHLAADCDRIVTLADGRVLSTKTNSRKS